VASGVEDQSIPCNATAVVRDLIFYLENEFKLQCHDTICVESLLAMERQNIPVERVVKAANVYSKELKSLIDPKGERRKQLLALARTKDDQMEGEGVVVPLSTQKIDVFVRSNPLSWECRLANISAQMVRYWLRTLMNPVPERSDLDTKTNRWNTRLYDCVRISEVPHDKEFNINVNHDENSFNENSNDRFILTDEIDSCGETFDDDKISSLLSNALAHIYGYLDLGSTDLSTLHATWKDRLLKVIPDEMCCATSLCLDGLGSARKPVCIEEEDWQALREHIGQASDFCAFHRRALFLERLLSVVEKIDWVDHWKTTVQEAAEKLVRMNDSCGNYSSLLNTTTSNEEAIDSNVNSNLDSQAALGKAILPEDKHLILLGVPFEELLRRLRTEILPMSSQRYEVCRANLRRTEKNFRLGLSMTKRKKLWMKEIGELESYWEDWLHPDTIFPSLSYIGFSSP